PRPGCGRDSRRLARAEAQQLESPSGRAGGWSSAPRVKGDAMSETSERSQVQTWQRGDAGEAGYRQRALLAVTAKSPGKGSRWIHSDQSRLVLRSSLRHEVGGSTLNILALVPRSQIKNRSHRDTG